MGRRSWLVEEHGSRMHVIANRSHPTMVRALLETMTLS
jgi:hypothetical protein